MAKRNAELITETAAVLLRRIQKRAEEVGDPDQIKALAEAFALVAEHDTNVAGPPGRAAVLR